MKNEPWFQTEEGIYDRIFSKLSALQNFLDDCKKAFEKYVQIELEKIDIDVEENSYPKEYSKEYLIRNFEESIYSEITPYFVLSYIILINSEFEKCLKQVCGKLKERFKLEMDLERWKDKCKKGLLEAARIYLFDHGKFQAPDINSWKSIEDIYIIRNIIVHNNLDYDKLGKKRKKTVDRLVKKKCGITLYIDPFSDTLDAFADTSSDNENYTKEPTRILIGWEFCEYSIEEAMAFFKELKTEHLKRQFGSLRLL